MPHRILGHYLYAILASGSVALSFLASVGESISTQTGGAVFAVGDAAPDSLSPVMMSWLGTFSAVAVVLGKMWSDMRTRDREADIEDAKAFGPVIIQAREELGDAKSDLKVARAKIADLEAVNRAQAAEMAAMQAKIGQIANSQNSVVAAVKKQQDKVKDVGKRMTEIEQAVGSSSNLELTVPPPAEDSTTIDLPTMG